MRNLFLVVVADDVFVDVSFSYNSIGRTAVDVTRAKLLIGKGASDGSIIITVCSDA